MATSATATEASQLAQLKKFTKVVADTGDFESMKAYEPQDATTNPTLILKAVQQDAYAPLLDKAVAEGKESGASGDALVSEIANRLLILFGSEILAIVPGRVSTEVDARLSFDTEESLALARHFIDLYEKKGIGRERILIKLASTWEGLKTAEILQKEGINCNMTLMFAQCQAVMASQVGAKLISPFVGRIYDWYKAKEGKEYHGDDDPGVLSVRDIYHYLKKFDHPTEVMGASFRKTDQIISLAGCDLLTISTDLLEELANTEAPVEEKLTVADAKASDWEPIEYNEKSFRFALNEDAMATEKLAEGIRKFAADAIKLEDMIREKVL